MASLNLFDYATKELSQDAVICWLIAWAGAKPRGKEEEKLRDCGRALVEALFSKWQDYWEVELGEDYETEVCRQERNIDVLARIDGRYVLLIEDKTDTRAYHDQLARYWELVVEGKTRLGPVESENVYPIYLKTGNHSLRDREHAEGQDYRVFDRGDLLEVLGTYSGRNEIVLDFRSYVERWQRDTESFREWTESGRQWAADGVRARRSWEGFFRWIEENCLGGGRDDWGPLGSLVGGYWGIWIEPEETSSKSRFAIWIEKNRISFRLYGAKRDYSVAGMNREKNYWAKAFTDRGGDRFQRPRRLQATRTKPMCVSEWRDWLEFDDSGRLDFGRTANSLKVARRILVAAMKSR